MAVFEKNDSVVELKINFDEKTIKIGESDVLKKQVENLENKLNQILTSQFNQKQMMFKKLYFQKNQLKRLVANAKQYYEQKLKLQKKELHNFIKTEIKRECTSAKSSIEAILDETISKVQETMVVYSENMALNSTMLNNQVNQKVSELNDAVMALQMLLNSRNSNEIIPRQYNNSQQCSKCAKNRN